MTDFTQIYWGSFIVVQLDQGGFSLNSSLF